MSTNYNLTNNNTTQIYINTQVFSIGLHWFLNTLMVFITLLGIIGNGLICYFFAAQKVRLTPFNLLLLNLSITDLTAAISAYPTIFIDLPTLRRFSQKTANIICAFSIGITVYAMLIGVSVLTLTYISLNRFVSIRYPMRTAWFKSRRNTICIIIIIWFVCIGSFIPNTLTFKFSKQYATCPRNWPKDFRFEVWSLFLMVLALVVPTIIMILAFFAARRHFKKMDKGTSSNTESIKRMKHTVELLGFLILA